MSSSYKTYAPIRPDLKDWPITHFSAGRDAFIQRLIDLVLSKLTESKVGNLELLNKTVYLEQQRVKTNPWKVDPGDEKEYWQSISNEITNTKSAANPDLEQIKLLRRIIHRYSEEIVGHFVPKTHLFARKILTSFFKRLYNNGWGRAQRGIWGSKKQLLQKIKVSGKIEELRSLFEKGTVVIVPTHFSNLDSILIGYGIDAQVGIPAFSYGAGLNLYDMEILAYFMNRMGAYRVDRRKKNPIYLETLKNMASLSLIEGLNHIFFPGGTRSRSGSIEDKLKLGLLNSVIDAQRHSILNDIDQKIFIIPLSLGYHFVLEAGSLIDQHLKIIGRERYLRSRKKSSIPRTIMSFMRLLRKHNSEVYLSFGQPMDVLGNKVDADGKSYDSRGNEVKIASYFTSGDIKTVDTQRESVYTRILADKIVDSFKKENIVLSSHLVAFAMYRCLEKQYDDFDIFDFMKVPVKNLSVQKAELLDEIRHIKSHLTQLEANEEANLSDPIKTDAEDCLADGLKFLGVYHSKKVIRQLTKGAYSTEDIKLLYYYHNKLTHYLIPALN